MTADGSRKLYYYTNYFSGANVTENTNNPGNSATDPAVTLEIGNTDSCSAINACANAAENNETTYYDSFDVHYSTASKSWECVLYYNRNTDSSYFNVANTSISQVYGYFY